MLELLFWHVEKMGRMANPGRKPLYTVLGAPMKNSPLLKNCISAMNFAHLSVNSSNISVINISCPLTFKTGGR